MRPEWIDDARLLREAPLERPLTANVDRLAVAMHNPELINHYGPILRHLTAREYDIVHAASDDSERAAIEKFAHGLGCAAIASEKALSEGRVYDAALGVHYGSAGNTPDGKPAIFSLAVTQIRLMYSIGKDNWLFSGENSRYDIILCFGPYHVNNLLPFTNARKVAIGYPRFDGFFNNPPDRARYLRDIGLNPERETIVWLPTHGPLCSIKGFAAAVGGLAREYNVAIKLHPLTPVCDPASVAALKEAGLGSYFTGSYDNSNLFAVADYVLADYGGSSFGALYTDKNLILLDVEGAEMDENLTRDSSSLMLRRWFPHFTATEADRIKAALGDTAMWRRQAEIRRALRDRFFAPYHGFASDVAAMAIRNRKRIMAGLTCV